MARQPMRPTPYLKVMESYERFDGINTVDSMQSMLNSELVDLTNIDLGERGSLRRRNGIVNHTRDALWSDIGNMTWGQLEALEKLGGR